MAALLEPPVATPQRTKKKLVRRAAPDRSQLIRHSVQGTFLLLNLWIGAQFYRWVSYYKGGGTGSYVSRPAGVEGWLPIAGLMNTKYLFVTGHVPTIHPAAMYLFLGFVLMSVLLKRAFCAWLCPVGFASEILWRVGQKLFGRSLTLPRWADIALRSLKYMLLALFVGVIGWMSAEMLEGFMSTPFGIVLDVKMMDFFWNMSRTALIVLIALAGLSLMVQNFWCRYLCPYGALLGIAAIVSPVKIRRDEQACIDCGRCSKACPSHLAVDKLVQVQSVECSACMLCLASCPAENALQLALPPRKAETSQQRWSRRAVHPLALTAVLAYIFFGAVLWARTTDHWQTHILGAVYLRLVPHAEELGHPGM
ncbi:4Fe-4S binding domain-containing protein [Bryocella elongata]|uniref:4Fe-4S binding domain-containing protein n=1 Tax=Bryocella elongata TaxID=863522 RepID=A0A1H5SS13_9BACT|nr:4Fe-4S binding protein [Bryocella elongata]SEF53325.1 4Fe-4S binding domain-containing protein [Bryocella elongata]